MRKATYKTLADITAVVHAIWLGSIIAGLPLSFRYKKLRNLSLAGIATTVGSWQVFGDCPLYLLENKLRQKANKKTTYTGSFTSHYLEKYTHIYIPAKVFTYIGYGYAALAAALVGKDLREVL